MHMESQQVDSEMYFENLTPEKWQAATFDGLVNSLVSVEQVTEKIFLELGHNINFLHGSAVNISQLANEALGVLNGEDGESSLHHLQLLVERCSLWLDTTDKKSAGVCRLLREVLLQVHDLDLPVSGLRKVIKTLHSLRVSTRIEASKGYASNAGVLAKSLDELGVLVHSKVIEIFERLKDLVPVIERSVQMEESARFGSILEASAEVEKARKFLAEVLQACMETNQWTDRLKDRSDGIASSFSEIVSALQFQDITRQRLEHVQRALKNLVVHLEKFSLRTDFSQDEQAERLFSCICKLQHDQVEFATREFVKAADNLSTNLQNMSANVISMADDTRELVRVSDDGDVNRYTVVLHTLRTIAEHLERTGEIHSLTVANLAEVTAGINKVSSLVEEIEYISEEMQLLAINAAISAAHARRSGAGLDVIAQNIQEVAEEACSYAVLLSERCNQIAGHAKQLQDMEENGQETGDVSTLLQEANKRMSSFSVSHSSLAKLTGQIDVDAGQLSREVFNIVASMNVGEVFSEKISPVLDRFKELSHGHQEGLNEDDRASLSDLFRELELCYTMDSERRVHKEFVQGQQQTADDTSSAQDEWAESRAHNLGDNVDLF